MGLILFDLDGTLVDPVPAFQAALEDTCREAGLTAPTPGGLKPRVGLGAARILEGLEGSGDPGALQRLVASWTSHLPERLIHCRLHEGVNLMLARLKRQGHDLHLLTTLPAGYGKRVAHLFDLNLCFLDVHGSDDPHATKGALLDRLQAAGILRPGGFLVGDRGDDMEAARAHGLRPVGAAWGFGGARELQASGAEAVLDDPSALDAWLLEQLPEPEVLDPFNRSE